MKLMNAIRLTIANFKSAYKSMFYRLLTFLLGVVLVYVWFYASLKNLFSNACFKELFSNIGGVIRSFLGHGEGSKYAELVSQSIRDCVNFVKADPTDFVVAFFGLLFILLLYRFLSGYSNFAMGNLINDHMSTISHYAYLSSLFRSFGKSTVYQLVYTVFTFVFDVAIILLSGLVFFVGIEFIGVFAFPVTVLCFVLLSALRLTLTSQFLPSVICKHDGVWKSFVKSCKLGWGNFRKLYGMYVLAVSLIYYLVVSVGVITFGAGLIMIIPLGYTFLICIQFSTYYSMHLMKYYIDYDHIYIPKELREHDENLLNGIDID